MTATTDDKHGRDQLVGPIKLCYKWRQGDEDHKHYGVDKINPAIILSFSQTDPEQQWQWVDRDKIPIPQHAEYLRHTGDID